MTDVVKINDIRLYVGFTKNAHNCYLMKKALVDANIVPIIMCYSDDIQHPVVFDSINTWEFGIEKKKANVVDFPFVTWKVYYNNYESTIEIAKTVDELKSLLNKKDLISV